MARAVLWTSAALIAWTQVVYGLFLAALRALAAPAAPLRSATPHPPSATTARGTTPAARGSAPRVSLIIAAHLEEAVIADKIANALALDWPREALEIVVAVDGGGDATASRARAAGADLVLELPRAGKVRTQDAGARAASGSLLAFSDANARWEPGALRELAGAFDDPAVGFACGRVSFVNEGGDNQEGVYWRYEMWLRGNESALASVTAGNGAIYAVRREAYIEVDAVMGHDLSFPFNMVKRGWRAVDVAGARATEKMVPSIEGEWIRKRRMMSHAWAIVLRGGMLDPRGYPPLYALMLLSHRVLRYATPLLHVVAALATLVLVVRGRARVAALAQLALLGAAAAGGRVRSRPLLIARYYVLTTASLALGLYDHLRYGTEAGWEQAEGTR